MEEQTIIISIIAIFVSGIIAILSLLLNFTTVRETRDLARASRRTLALQRLSQEELALESVRTECLSVQSLVENNSNSFGDQASHYLSEAKRIVDESNDLLQDVRLRRDQVEQIIANMSSVEIEKVISIAEHKITKAEAQFARTSRSREDMIFNHLRITNN